MQPRFVFLFVTIAYLAATIPYAYLMPLSNDEIYTFAVSSQKSCTRIWDSLQNGADNLPPLDYCLRHASMELFGTSELSFRLTSIFAIWIACLFTFLLVSRRAPPTYAAATVLCVLSACGLFYATWGRGYALVLATYSAAVFFWDRTSRLEHTYRSSALCGIALALAFYSHYYAVLIFLPFGVVELYYLVIKRRIRPLFYALIASGLSCLPLIPLIQVASRFKSNFWAAPTLTRLFDIYPELLAGAVPGLILAVLGLSLYAARQSKDQSDLMSPRDESLSKLVVLLVFMSLLPLVEFVLAKVVTGAFSGRYVLASSFAIVTLVFLLVSRTVLPKKYTGEIIVTAMGVCFLIVAAGHFRGILTHGAHRPTFYNQLVQLTETLSEPVVLSDDGLFVELSYHDRNSTLAHMFFIYDVDPTRRSNVDHSLEGLNRVMPLSIATYSDFREKYHQFAFIGPSGHPLLVRAYQEGAKLEWRQDSQSNLAYWLVAWPEQ